MQYTIAMLKKGEEKMVRRIFLVTMSLILSAGILAGCAGDTGDNGSLFPAVSADTIGTNVVNANSEFAFNIFRNVYETDDEGNLFLCPASISTALAMVMNGADGNTLAEMQEVLRFKGIDTAEVNSGLGRQPFCRQFAKLHPLTPLFSMI